MFRNRSWAYFLLGAWLGFLLMFPLPAFALDRDVRAVLVTSAYGVAGGTALGLLSFPLTGQSRGIFLGSSIGLYLGIIAGLYYIDNRAEVDAALGSAPRTDPARDAFESALSRSPWARWQQTPWLEWKVPVYRF